MHATRTSHTAVVPLAPHDRAQLARATARRSRAKLVSHHGHRAVQPERPPCGVAPAAAQTRLLPDRKQARFCVTTAPHAASPHMTPSVAILATALSCACFSFMLPFHPRTVFVHFDHSWRCVSALFSFFVSAARATPLQVDTFLQLR